MELNEGCDEAKQKRSGRGYSQQRTTRALRQTNTKGEIT
jgi:hypothetical protein